jgi:hypothetical protein
VLIGSPVELNTENSKQVKGKNMKNVRRTIIAAAAAVMSYVGVASAIPVTDTLADLVANNGMIGIGDKVFSGFTYNDTGLTSFDATKIIVTASYSGGIYYLDWTGNMSLFTGGTLATADLALGYTVTAGHGVINVIDQQYTGSAQGGATLAVDETASVGGVIVGYSHLDPIDLSDPPAELTDILDIVPPQTALIVVKDLHFAVTSDPNSDVSISDVKQSFHQVVPDGGATVMLLGAALSAMALFRKKLIA